VEAQVRSSPSHASHPCHSSLQKEIESRLSSGRCVYCGTPATPDRPLTREHVIPRSKGGHRKDSRIIVPACGRCNRHRGSQEIVLFLLARPGRISSFLDYLASLPPDAMRAVDLRVFAELLAAVWLLADNLAPDAADAVRPARVRRIHRRRYAARRIVRAVADRLERARERPQRLEGPSCMVAHGPTGATSEPAVAGALLTTLSLFWDVPADRVLAELLRERQRIAGLGGQAATTEWHAPPMDGEAAPADPANGEAGDGRRGRRRFRVDQRRGRAATR
jgi:hypothetical protein